MSSNSHFVIMKSAPETVGRYVHAGDWDKSEAKGRKHCESSSTGGQQFELWTRSEYEQWYNERITPYYQH